MIDIYVHIAAAIGLSLWVLLILFEPSLFGKEREPYSFGGWMFRVVFGLLIIVPVYCKVLGFI